MRRARGEAKMRRPCASLGAGGAGGAFSSACCVPGAPQPPEAAGALAGACSAGAALAGSASGGAAALPSPLPAEAAAPSSALSSSPSSSRMAIGSFTGTFSVPSVTRMRPTRPSSTASTSIVALSVSISAITSPALTSSPSLTCHLARLPSVIVGERAGISTFTVIFRLPLRDPGQAR